MNRMVDAERRRDVEFPVRRLVDVIIRRVPGLVWLRPILSLSTRPLPPTGWMFGGIVYEAFVRIPMPGRWSLHAGFLAMPKRPASESTGARRVEYEACFGVGDR